MGTATPAKSILHAPSAVLRPQLLLPVHTLRPQLLLLSVHAHTPVLQRLLQHSSGTHQQLFTTARPADHKAAPNACTCTCTRHYHVAAVNSLPSAACTWILQHPCIMLLDAVRSLASSKTPGLSSACQARMATAIGIMVLRQLHAAEVNSNRIACCATLRGLRCCPCLTCSLRGISSLMASA
jgi:hypothetical protein